MGIYFIIVTARTCGYCVQSRGDGKINTPKNPGMYFSKDSIDALIGKLEDVKIINIHLNSLAYNTRGDIFFNEIAEFSVTSIKDGKHLQYFYKKDIKKEDGSVNVKLEILSRDNGLIKEDNLYSKPGEEKIKWYDFIRKAIPYNVFENGNSFPGIAFSTSKDWEKAVVDKTDFSFINVRHTKDEGSFFYYPFTNESGSFSFTRKEQIDVRIPDLVLFNKKILELMKYKDDFLFVENRKKEVVEIKEEPKKIYNGIRFLDSYDHNYLFV
jgi:hypothetical protein